MMILIRKCCKHVSLLLYNLLCYLDSQYSGKNIGNSFNLNEVERQIRPEDWHNIPKCVVEAVRFLMDRIKFESGKIGIH